MCCTCFSRCLRHRTPSPDLRFHPISLDHPRDTPVLTATPSPPASTSTTSTASPTRPHRTQSPTTTTSVPLPSSLTLHLSLSPSTGLLVSGEPVSFPHHRHQSQGHRLRAVLVARTAIERPAIRSSTLQSCSQRGRHLLLVDGRLEWTTDDLGHSDGQGGRSSVHQSVHDERWSTAEQLAADICEWIGLISVDAMRSSSCLEHLFRSPAKLDRRWTLWTDGIADTRSKHLRTRSTGRDGKIHYVCHAINIDAQDLLTSNDFRAYPTSEVCILGTINAQCCYSHFSIIDAGCMCSSRYSKDIS